MNLEKGKDNETPLDKGKTQELIDVVAQLQEELKRLKAEKTNSSPIQGFSIEDVAKIVATTIREEKSPVNFNKGIEEKDIPKDDFDKDGVIFCAPSAGYCLVDDMRQGHRIVLPYNKEAIFFSHQGTRRFQQGKHMMTASFCTYKSHSKKEQDWIRKHTLFGIVFYENSNQAMKIDMVRATKLARLMNTLRDFELPSIIQRAKEYDVPVSQDIHALRVNLALAMVDKELDSEKTASQRKMETRVKEKSLLEDK